MDCKKTEELLSPHLEDDLSLEVKSEVEKHLKACKNCSLLLSLMSEAQKSLAGFPEKEVSADLLGRLYNIPTRKRRFRLSLDFLGRPSLQPILAAATVLVTLISFYAFHPNRNLINKTIEQQIHSGYSKIEKLYAKAESFTDSLNEYKDTILVSLKNINPFRGTED